MLQGGTHKRKIYHIKQIIKKCGGSFASLCLYLCVKESEILQRGRLQTDQCQVLLKRTVRDNMLYRKGYKWLSRADCPHKLCQQSRKLS